MHTYADLAWVQIAFLEQQRSNKLDEAALRVQTRWRMFVQRRRYLKITRGLRIMQAGMYVYVYVCLFARVRIGVRMRAWCVLRFKCVCVRLAACELCASC